MLRQHLFGQSVPQSARGASVALGNFDGVHRGHQAVITAADDQGAQLGTAVFAPHPRRHFQPEAPPFRLQSDAQRARALQALGVQDLFVIRFDRALAQLSDEAFARDVLYEWIGAAHVCVGADFRFGKGRMGDVDSLRRLGARLGFGVTVVAPVTEAGVRYSSTAIRNALARGAMDEAAAMLTRPWAIEGEVQKGFQRGRGFGFATANLGLADYVQPRLGVYAVRVRLDDCTSLPGVASIGVNPTVGALPAPLLEAHIFDFDADLYGKSIEVELVAFLRDEAHFETVEALKVQMAEDAARARAMLDRSGTTLPSP
jgi:riboflavin kinase/FMN adenylyltransferase